RRHTRFSRDWSSDVCSSDLFFSFGTNDLTQTTMGLSRDDYTKFSGHYEAVKVFSADPFASIDQGGVGKIIEMAIKLGRSTRPDRSEERRVGKARRRRRWEWS